MMKRITAATRPYRPLLALAATLPLAACISFGEDPPPTLMTLTAETPLGAGPGQTASAANMMAVLVPSAPQALMTQRVPVQASATGIAYLKNAQWVESPNRLFRNLLAETISVRTGRVVNDPRNFSLAPDTRLSGRLTSFGLDAAARAVVVTYDASLTRGEPGEIQARRFEARVPVSAQTGSAVAVALNRAANQVAVEVADWVGR
jgi:cholesterol transport system auxiliary component